MKTIAIGFDGVIHKYSKGWYDGTIYDEPVEGVLEAFSMFQALGFQIVVFTARENLHDVHVWIQDKLFKPNAEGMRNPERICFKVTNKKPVAFAYIDARGIRFTNWKDILNYF